MATYVTCNVHRLSETSEDVLSLKRVGPDSYEGTLRSGETWRGDEQLLSSLPQGMAKLATLRVREAVEKNKRPISTAAGEGGVGASEHVCTGAEVTSAETAVKKAKMRPMNTVAVEVGVGAAEQVCTRAETVGAEDDSSAKKQRTVRGEQDDGEDPPFIDKVLLD